MSHKIFAAILVLLGLFVFTPPPQVKADDFYGLAFIRETAGGSRTRSFAMRRTAGCSPRGVASSTGGTPSNWKSSSRPRRSPGSLATARPPGIAIARCRCWTRRR